MILCISELLKNNIEPYDFDVSFNEPSLSRDGAVLKLNSPVRVSGTAVYNDGIVNIKGSITTSYNLECSRCLKDFDYQLHADFDENFSKEKSDDVYLINNDNIDLTDMVVDNIILLIPLKPLCDENCKGICPSCGKDLNSGNCECKTDEIDPRFAVLKNLFNGDQGGVNNGKSCKKMF